VLFAFRQLWLIVVCSLKCGNNHQHDRGHLRKEEEEEEEEEELKQEVRRRHTLRK